jgi:hypothetical protein
MIEKRFSCYPQKLWITLWANPASNSQSLDFPRAALHCPLSWQALCASKINDLARIRAIPDAGQADRHGAAAQHDFWG